MKPSVSVPFYNFGFPVVAETIPIAAFLHSMGDLGLADVLHLVSKFCGQNHTTSSPYPHHSEVQWPGVVSLWSICRKSSVIALRTQQRRDVFFAHHPTLSNYALPSRRVQEEAVNRTTDRHKIPTCTLQTSAFRASFAGTTGVCRRGLWSRSALEIQRLPVQRSSPSSGRALWQGLGMSTSPCLDVHFTTRAVIEWESDNESDRATRILAKPDPKVSSITLATRFDSKDSLFDIHVPLKLKGLDSTSDITLRACASSIISLDLVKNAPVSSEVEQEFKSPALGLHFQLNRHLDILVPIPALEPIRPAGRARSGVVLDAIREFSRATAFTVYIEARNASPKLQSVSDVVGQGLFKTSCSSRFQLASMYAGLGAKIVQLVADDTLAPPSYEETEPPPPPPPIDPKPDRKRPRQDTVTERAEEIALIWAELQMLKQAKDADGKRIAFLEKENKELRETVAKLQERYEAFDKSQQDIHHSFGALETTVEKNTHEFEESVGNELAELREDISQLDHQLSFIQEGQVSDESVAKIKDAVLLDITTRLSGD
ncbi:hypothetical protein F52700_1855 [Fusarium sp. NRRL 52700]|nr:hypothetical protein F52700_1855 [Fusarium sp. NRRL 52700]